MEDSKQHQKDMKQIKSLVGQLRKAKLKCLELGQHLNRELPNLEFYQILEVKCKRTAENLDRQGINKMLNQLVRSLAELYEEERDLMYETQKNSFKKIIPPVLTRRQRQHFTKQEIGPFKVPTYFSRCEPGIQKIQRISNYIQSIGKSMDSLRKSMEPGGEWNPSDFFTYEPEYVNAKRKVQQFRMRDQEIVELLQRKIEEEIGKVVEGGETVEEDDDFIVVKVAKKKVDDYGKKESKPVWSRRKERIEKADQSYHPHSMIEPKRGSKSKRTNLQKINQQETPNDGNNQNPNQAEDTTQMDLHITSFQKSNRQNYSRISKLDNSQLDCDQNGNYVYMVRKVSPESQLNSSIISSISSLRSMRKKVFDDDIWDQFQKL